MWQHRNGFVIIFTIFSLSSLDAGARMLYKIWVEKGIQLKLVVKHYQNIYLSFISKHRVVLHATYYGKRCYKLPIKVEQVDFILNRSSHQFGKNCQE